jgi:hypothetical protein
MSHEEGLWYWVIRRWKGTDLKFPKYEVIDDDTTDPNDVLRDYDPCSVAAGPFAYEDEAEEAIERMDFWYSEGMSFQIQYDRLEEEEFVRDRARKNRRAERFVRKELEKDGKLNPAVRRILRDIKEGR